MAYWYFDICGSKVPTEPGKDEPEYSTGHYEIHDVTLGMIWSLHETCKVCSQEHTVAAFFFPVCNTPSESDPLGNTAPLRLQSPRCSGYKYQKCLISSIRFEVARCVVVSRAPRISATRT